MSDSPTYHDLHITTAQIPRTSIFNLPYGLKVTCSRVTGWELWDVSSGREVPLAGEYAAPGNWLVLDVAGHVIVGQATQAPVVHHQTRFDRACVWSCAWLCRFPRAVELAAWWVFVAVMVTIILLAVRVLS